MTVRARIKHPTQNLWANGGWHYGRYEDAHVYGSDVEGFARAYNPPGEVVWEIGKCVAAPVDEPCPPTSRSPEAMREPPTDRPTTGYMRSHGWEFEDCRLDLVEGSDTVLITGGSLTKHQALNFLEALKEAMGKLP